MVTLQRVNPLKHDALTVDTVKVDDKIIYWIPGNPTSVHRVTIECGPYTNDDGDYVVDVIHRDGHRSTELTSTLGLSGDRYHGGWTAAAELDEGQWIAIAIINEETD